MFPQDLWRPTNDDGEFLRMTQISKPLLVTKTSPCPFQVQLQMIVKPCQVAFLNYGFCQQSWSQGIPAMSGVSGKFHKRKCWKLELLNK